MIEFIRLMCITWHTGQWFVFQIYVLFVWFAMLPRTWHAGVFYFFRRHGCFRNNRTKAPRINALVHILNFLVLFWLITCFYFWASQFFNMPLVLLITVVVYILVRRVYQRHQRLVVDLGIHTFDYVAYLAERLFRFIYSPCFYVQHLMRMRENQIDELYSAIAVTTIFREKPEILTQGLRRVKESLIEGTKQHLLVGIVDGHPKYGEENKILLEIVCRYCDVVLLTNAHNKRWNLKNALDMAFQVEDKNKSKFDTVIFLDSDTIPIGEYSRQVIRNLLRPFGDPHVGGITTAQEIINPNKNWIRRLNHWLEMSRLLSSQPALAVWGEIGCLPGRMYAVRSCIIRGRTAEIANDTFSYFGRLRRPCVAGDDRKITNMILQAGYRTILEPSARVATDCPDTFFETCKMWTRWGRSSQGYTLRSPWLFRYPFAAFVYWTDILISLATVYIVAVHWPLTMLLGTASVPFIQAIITALLGMMLTMAIRQMPYLLRSPRDWLMLPLFVIIVTFAQFIRVYALLTQHKIGEWGTRGGEKPARIEDVNIWVMHDPQGLLSNNSQVGSLSNERCKRKPHGTLFQGEILSFPEKQSVQRHGVPMVYPR